MILNNMRNVLLPLLFIFFLVFSGKAEENDPAAARKAEYYYMEGIRLKNAEKFDTAFEMFRHAIEIDPSYSAALYELSNFYLHIDRTDEALSLLKKAIAIDSSNFHYQTLYAETSQTKGDTSEAVRVYELLAASHPDKPELNYYLGHLYAVQNEYLKAIEAYDNLEQSFGVSQNTAIVKYRLYDAIEKEEEALNEIEKLIRKFPDEINYLILMGNICMEKGLHEKAYEYYQQAEQTAPNNPDLLIGLVNYYDTVNDSALAMQQIEKAMVNPGVETENKLSILSRYISMLQRTQKGMESANTLFDLLLEQHPQTSELHLMYGSFLQSQEKFDDAKIQFQLVTEKEASRLDGWLYLLGVYIRKDDIDSTILVARKSLTHHPNSPELYYFLGISYYQKHELKQALRTFEEGIKTIDKEKKELFSDYYGQMGDLYYQLGKKEKSFDSYEISLANNPDNIMVLNNYAYFLSLEKNDLSKAERMSGRCINLDPQNSTYLDTYAWIYYMQGKYTLAKIYIESAISNGGGNMSEVREHYGDILFKLNDKEGAVREWQKAWELAPESKTLKRKIKKETGKDPQTPAIKDTIIEVPSG